MTWYSAFLLRRAPLLALAVTLATCVAAAGVARLDFDEDPRNFILRDDADRRVLERFFADFGPDDTDILAAVTGLDPGDVPEIERVLRLIDVLRDAEGVLYVATPFDARRVGQPLVPLFPRSRDNFTPERFRAAFAAARKHPALAGQLISPDGSVLFLLIHMRETTGGIAPLATQVDHLRDLVAGVMADSPVRVTLAGHPPLRVDVVRAVQREFYRMLTLSAVATVVVAAVAFRTPGAVVMSLAGPAIGLVWTLGWMGLTGQRINGLNTILPSLIFVLGFSDSAHLIVAWQNARRAGLSNTDAVTRSLVTVGTACVLMVLTTAVGFGALGVAEIASVRQFGIAGGVGTVLALAAVLSVMPLVALGRDRTTRGAAPAVVPAEPGEEEGDPGPLGRLALACLGRPVTTLVVAVGAIALFAALSVRLASDIRWLEMLPAGDPTVAVTRLCDETLGGSLIVSATVEWPEGLDVGSPEVLGMFRAVGAELARTPDLHGVFSPLELLEGFARDGVIDATAVRQLDRIPEHHLHRLLRPDLRRALVTAHVPDVGAARLLPQFDDLAGRLAAVQADHPGFQLGLTGSAVTAARNVYQIIEDTRSSLFTSAAIILAMTIVAFRSVRYGMLCILPNMFPMLATSAVLVVTGEPLRLASAVTFSIALGLADDSAIHFMAAFLRARRDGLSRHAAVERVLRTSGRAMIIAAATLAAGMAPLLFCRLPPLRTFAALSIFAISAALVADFLILPSVLVCFSGRMPGDDRRTADGA